MNLNFIKRSTNFFEKILKSNSTPFLYFSQNSFLQEGLQILSTSSGNFLKFFLKNKDM